MTERKPLVTPSLLVSHKEARRVLGAGHIPAITQKLFYELVRRGVLRAAVTIDGKRYFLRQYLEDFAAIAWSRAARESMRRGHENAAPSYGVRSRFLPEG